MKDALRRLREMAARRVKRWTRTAIAFALTLAAVSALYFIFIATQGGVSADLNAPRPAAPAGGSPAVAMAAGLLSLQSDDLDSGALFLPDRHRRRVSLFQDGATTTVSAFVEVLARRRATDRDLDRAAVLLAAPRADLAAQVTQRRDEAREALRRFNARLGARGPGLERSEAALAALARAAAATCEAHEQAVREAAVRGRFGPADPGAEAAFFRARGAAFAWARLIAAYRDELPERQAARQSAAVAAAIVPLAEAATFEPRVLFNAPRGAVAPNHLERMATDLAAAVAAARRLSAAADAR
jgi:hypothetical protein